MFILASIVLGFELGPCFVVSIIVAIILAGCVTLKPVLSGRPKIDKTKVDKWLLMPRSHIHGSPRRFYYGLNRTDDPGNANFRSPIRSHYIRMIKYYYV